MQSDQTLLESPASRAVAPRQNQTATRPAGALRLLTFSTLYPNAAQPNHGVFVENRLRHLVASGEATSTVLAPVPWFPFGRLPFGGARLQGWTRYAGIAARESRHGITVHHPRFAALPGIGMLTGPAALHAAARGALAQLIAAGHRFDAIDAHYAYPDGVAAIRLGREFGLPVVITARGSDISQLPDHRLPRRMIQQAIQRAAALIAVSVGLKDGLVKLGAPADKVTVLRNGVDLEAFRPAAEDRMALRAGLGLGEGPLLISVGHLIPRKGHDLVIRALPQLPGHALMVLGEGPERGALLALAQQLGVADRVHLLGAQPHAELPRYYSAADALVLASAREGWANVLLESMACGTPVVASPAWGSREAVRSPAAGLVMPEATPEAIAATTRRLLGLRIDRAATRAYAEGFGWEETTAGQLSVFRKVLACG
ncbi:glycosyltransferase family 4 protein [Falsiroseomonas tokyonensis]|uniref:Glycosyltransferase family 4 protein n=1 Tax=Falsiroseomonas tokyonensis TaxID=430521 RepID=A0ABV7BRQ3_9PROT|nr:glycosyltransferase family 4 protein [Falsiroseomonas tokyonensis]MBU8536728.1 glycosyltransferase family 4 protein [Falsiroseomonas tokyonensis]